MNSKILALLTAMALLAGWAGGPAPCRAQGKQNWTELRNRMVDEEVAGAGVKNARVLEAMRKTPRHEFVPLAQRKGNTPYLDMALPIGESQTISPPFIVAYMTEQLDPQPTDRVLEIGTGSGYQAAVLSGLVRAVYTIEIVAPLGQRAAKTLKQLGYSNVYTKIGDGFQGWPEHAPFDKIIVTCSPEKVPLPLAEQLREGGRMIVPVGERYQQTLYLLKKQEGKLVPEALRPTLFVPMTGRAEDNRQVLPDPTRPEIRNGDFEEVVGDPPSPVNWHYLQQGEVVHDGTAASGKNCLVFRNSQPGRHSQAIQGFAVDGRKVRQLEIALRVRGTDLRPDTAGHSPRAAVFFYDENRAIVGEVLVGPWRGSFPWQRETRQMAVPPRAREAILVIGLMGGLGEIAYDAVELHGGKGK